jgi:hypothetical protein
MASQLLDFNGHGVAGVEFGLMRIWRRNYWISIDGFGVATIGFQLMDLASHLLDFN